MSNQSFTRRAFVVAGGVIGGGLLLGIGGVTGYLALHDRRGVQQDGLVHAEGEGSLVNLWIRISPDNRITLLSPHTEMGQGAQTGLLQIVADELDADWEQFDVVMAPATPEFTNGALVRGFLVGDDLFSGWVEKLVESGFYTIADTMEMQLTGGSMSIRGTGWPGLRYSAAAARGLLVKAAASKLGVPESELTTASATVTHAKSGQSVTYGEVAEIASTMSIPRGTEPKARGTHRYVGKSIPRIDLPDKIFGTAVYGIDSHVDGMLYGAVVSSGVVGTEVASIDNEDEVTSRRGVHSVHRVHQGVAVVADNPWRAEQAVRAVRFEVAPHEHAGITTETLIADQRKALDDDVDTIHREGSPGTRLREGTVIEAEYVAPFLAHATMEPLNALVWSEGGKMHVVTGVQAPLPSRNHVASVVGMDPEDVVLHPMTMGGGFGRRSARSSVPESGNWLTQAAQLHKATGKPVKTTWSREQDTRRGTYRPMVVARLRGRLGDDGVPDAWETRVYGRLVEPEHTVPRYAIPNIYAGHVDAEPYLPWGAWRSVDASQNAFFVESFVDELALAAGRDPVDMRLAMLDDRPRHANVLRTVAKMAGWRRGIDDQRRALGVALFESFGSIVGHVAEVSMENGGPRVHRVWAAIDCGMAVNPDSVEAQVQGAIQFGLSAALHGRIDVENGAVKQSNFHDYRVVRMADAPRTTVKIIESDGPVGGAGEPGLPPIAPAVANAVALLDERKRRLPLSS